MLLLSGKRSFLARREGNQFALYFVGVSGKSYQLQGAANLRGPWQPIGDPFASTGGLTTFRETLAGGSFFWRVIAIALTSDC